MRTSDYLVKELEKITDTVFYVSGGGIMHLVDSLRKSKLKAIHCHHEQAAAIAAEGYSRIKGIGVCLVTTGPGGTNAITGVAGAWLDSIPMLVISGQVKTEDITPKDSGLRSTGFQELNVLDLVRPITKIAKSVKHPMEVKLSLNPMVTVAKSGRPGPVWLEIPLDIQKSQLIPNLDIIVEKIKEAKYPLILIGNGVRLSGGIDILHKVLRKLKIPVVSGMFTSTDILDSRFPGYLGSQGMWGNKKANQAIDNCDLLLIIGDRLDLTQTSYDWSKFASQALRIMVDIDSNVLVKKTARINIPICCDAKYFLEELYGRL